MGFRLINELIIEGCADEQKLFFNNFISCQDKDDWYDLSTLIPTVLTPEQVRANWHVFDVDFFWDADRTVMSCYTINRPINGSIYNISKQYTKLLFTLVVSEQMHAAYDASYVFHNGKVFVDERHEINSTHSFFDHKGQVINIGCTVATTKEDHFIYKRKNMEIDECYDIRGENPEEVTLILVDEHGNEVIEKMLNVTRVNSWTDKVAALKQQLLNDE